MLLHDNQANIYNQKKTGLPLPNKAAVELSREQLEGMLKVLDDQKDLKTQILDRARREEVEAQLKLARRREYYYKRVRHDFAPEDSDDDDDEAEQRGDESPMSPGERQKRQRLKERRRRARERRQA